jgi:hypothetical protein
MKTLLNTAIIIFGIILSPTASYSKALSDIFNPGIFNTTWNMSLEELKSIYPHGKSQKVSGTIRYFINDDRSLFGIDRKESSFVGFIFNSNNQLTSVSIGMPTGWNEAQKVKESITTSLGVDSISSPNSTGTPLTVWKDDSNIELNLMDSAGVLIIKVKPTPSKDVSKEALGF